MDPGLYVHAPPAAPVADDPAHYSPGHPVESLIRGGDIWVDLAQHDDPHQHQREWLQVGLERNIPLVIGKTVLVLMEDGGV